MNRELMKDNPYQERILFYREKAARLHNNMRRTKREQSVHEQLLNFPEK